MSSVVAYRRAEPSNQAPGVPGRAFQFGAVKLDPGQLWIHDLAANQEVLVRGLEVVGGTLGTLEQRVPLRLDQAVLRTPIEYDGPGKPLLSEQCQ